ncbi:sarcosine oxidase subunit delta [Nocardiopsis potens]|uniref:sarcosine oxidase subunit delta n=1 Tax=Nocardiopsis potens TaxID=1246458 RepID=UPI00034D1FA5|nr:sarcosine oxidase subunit delta [Nocardiopsis potens]
MLLIPCPWCGPRDECEFRYGGQSHIAHPAAPASLTDAEWADYLFFRDNPEGLFTERWFHAAGCRRWCDVVRHTADYRVLTSAPCQGGPSGGGEW